MGKKYAVARKLVEKPAYTLADAMPLVKKAAFAKFDETVELAMRLGVDPKHADQMVRGTVILPHGLGARPRRSWSSPRARSSRRGRTRARTTWAATTW